MKKTFIGVSGVLLAIAVVCLALTAPDEGHALSPPEPVSGEVVFSNAGRIVTMRADGSERTVLTRRSARVGTRNFGNTYLDLGDHDPAISPDGQQLAFLRDTEKAGVPTQSLMVGTRNGTELDAVLSYRHSFLSSVDWDAGGHLVVTLYAYVGSNNAGRDLYQQRFLRLDADGENQEILLAGSPGSFLKTPWLSVQNLSSDGTSLLYVRANPAEFQLRIRDLEDDSDRLVAFGVSQASFSPDGDQIVFSAERCLHDNASVCDNGKWLRPGLWTVPTTGGEPKRLISDGSAAYPSYSPDGSRILFSSARNVPDAPDFAREVYSVALDGSCLTWLTNGSPSSNSPSWGPEPGADYSPGACGAAGRQPLVELRPPPARKLDPRPRLWAGPRVGSRLPTSFATYWPGGRSEIYNYEDCAYFDPARCSEPLTLESASRCRGFDQVEFGARHRVMKRRGTTVARTWGKRGIDGTLVLSGRAAYGIGESFLTQGGGRASTFADHLQLINLLRPVGKPLVPGSNLPAPVKVVCR